MKITGLYFLHIKIRKRAHLLGYVLMLNAVMILSTVAQAGAQNRALTDLSILANAVIVTTQVGGAALPLAAQVVNAKELVLKEIVLKVLLEQIVQDEAPSSDVVSKEIIVVPEQEAPPLSALNPVK